MNLLADIDATCAALGFEDEGKYYMEPDAPIGVQHLIWILRRDTDNHEYRRHLGKAQVLKTDLVPMLCENSTNEKLVEVLLRLLVILTNPTLLLYRDGLPKDGAGRRVVLELIDIIQGYKEAFVVDKVWAAIGLKLHKCLEVDWALRSEEQGILIERVLVLVRNVLQIPANPEAECRADNDASVHDQVIWALHRSGMLDLILFILSSSDENQYHLHALEIVSLLYREQTASSLADASLQRSAEEKHRDEQELITIRRREKQKHVVNSPLGRHSRFGGTYVVQNMKSVSDKDIICHQSLGKAVAMDFDKDKNRQKKSHRHIKEETVFERRSAFSVRLLLREYCIEVLGSAYNSMVKQIRRLLERADASSNHDDSYLLWAIKFFMEFSRLSGLPLKLYSESLSIQCFHWVLTRMQHHMDMMETDKKQARLWGKRLHVSLKTFKELLLSMIALTKIKDDKVQALYQMLLNNICYVLEYRECVLHLLLLYNENRNTKAYLQDAIETANIFIKMMEKFCRESVVVQERRIPKRGKKKATTRKQQSTPEEEVNYDDKWAEIVSELSDLLAGEVDLPEEQHPIPFDAASEKDIDDQKEDCMLRIYTFLQQRKFKHAILLTRAAREVWPENDCFGIIGAPPEDELLLLREIFVSNIVIVENNQSESNENGLENEDEEGNEEYNERGNNYTEKMFRFEDYTKRLVNPKIVRACTVALSDWEKISTTALKSTVTILYRIAYECKCPAMLYQAVLFRIFQQVFKYPSDKHNAELQRLAVFVVRKFVETAATNPKIYAELLFYKNVRECYDLENDYRGDYETGPKAAWTEEEETELRMLFEENQKNPETDKDVIDWILDNLIDKSRSRRGVMKKLREMGLVFKKPTKKSNAEAANKNLWQFEEDEKLRNVYDEYRLNEDCLTRILEAFGESRSKNAIINRMIQIHLIADRSEIISKKRSKRHSKKATELFNSHSESETGSVSDNSNAPGSSYTTRHLKKNSKRVSKPSTGKLKQRKPRVRTPLDVGTVKSLLQNVDERYRGAIEWIKEAFNEACEDIDELAEDPEDGVPLVPLLDLHREAIEEVNFKRLLISLGIQPPINESEHYWRIPNYLNVADLQVRAKVLNESNVENQSVNNSLTEQQDETDESKSDDSDTIQGTYNDIFNEKRTRFDDLVFTKSDIEDEYREPLKPHNKPRQNDAKKKPAKKIIKISKGINLDDMIQSDSSDDVDFDKLRSRLLDSDSSNQPESIEVFDTLKKSPSPGPKINSKRSRIRKKVIELDSSDDEVTITNGAQNVADKLQINTTGEITDTQNSDKYGLEDCNLLESNVDGIVTSTPFTTINLINDDDNNDELSGENIKQGSKRIRSMGLSDSDSDNDINVSKKRRENSFHRKRIPIIDDDDDSENN